MRVTIKCVLLFVCVALSMFLQDAGAEPIYLPDSTYGQANGWQGTRYYTEDDYQLRVDFNVYDTADSEFAWTAALGLGNTDKYIYAYQIWNAGAAEVMYFGLLDLAGIAIDESLMNNTTAQEEPAGYGVSPAPLESVTQGIWTFAEGTLITNEYSWFLIFSTDYAPTAGDFEIRATVDDGELPTPEVPEPSTIGLLGFGGAALL